MSYVIQAGQYAADEAALRRWQASLEADTATGQWTPPPQQEDDRLLSMMGPG